MRGTCATGHRLGALAVIVALGIALPASVSLADTRHRAYRHDHRSHNSGALMGGIIGGAILGTMIFSMTRPYDPPRYVYVEPPPTYYVPPPAYPPVPVYPAPEAYAPPVYVPAPAPPPARPTLTQRLEELEQACKRGLLTKSECEYRRKVIIEGM